MGYGGNATYDADNNTFSAFIENFAAAHTANSVSFQTISDSNKTMNDQMCAMQEQVAQLSSALAATTMGTTQQTHFPPLPQYSAPMTTPTPFIALPTVYPPQPPSYHPPHLPAQYPPQQQQWQQQAPNAQQNWQQQPQSFYCQSQRNGRYQGRQGRGGGRGGGQYRQGQQGRRREYSQGYALPPGPPAYAQQAQGNSSRPPNPIKRFANWNYFHTHGCDIEHWHTSATYPKAAPGHVWTATIEN